MNDLSQRIIEMAQSGKIKQIPKWKFIAARVFIAILFIMILINGALAFGLLLESLWPENSLSGRGHGFNQLALGALPFIWIAFLSLLLIFGYFLFKRFKYGYRFNGVFITVLLLNISVIGGIGAYKMNLAFKVHRMLMHNVTLYNQAFDGHRLDNWLKPDQGRLAGTFVKEISSGFFIKDFKGKEWIIQTSDSIQIKRAKSFKEIRVIGQLCGLDFCATNIAPWNHMGKGMKMGKNAESHFQK